MNWKGRLMFSNKGKNDLKLPLFTEFWEFSIHSGFFIFFFYYGLWYLSEKTSSAKVVQYCFQHLNLTNSKTLLLFVTFFSHFSFRERLNRNLMHVRGWFEWVHGLGWTVEYSLLKTWQLPEYALRDNMKIKGGNGTIVNQQDDLLGKYNIILFS